MKSPDYVNFLTFSVCHGKTLIKKRSAIKKQKMLNWKLMDVIKVIVLENSDFAQRKML